MKASRLAAVLGATMALALPTAAAAAPGDLDTSWAGDGIREEPGFEGSDVAIQSDGKVVVASAFSSGLLRYNADGTPDASFGGGDGVVEPNQPLEGVAIQPDGKIVAVGGFSDFYVARFDADGSPDTSFDGDGEAEADFGGFESARAVAIQADGRIVVVGSAGGDFAFAHFTSSGAPDTGFDSDGKQTVDFGGSDFAEGVVVQSSGRIVAAGHSDGDFALAGLTDAGAPDGTFGSGGLRTTDFGAFERAGGIALMSDERIVVAGDTASDFFALARYDANGTLDSSCDGDGKLTTDFGTGFQAGRDVAVQFNDKIVAVGAAGNDIALARYEAGDCAPDATFGGGDGEVTTPMPNGNGANAVAIQPDDGKIVVTASIAGEPPDQWVARYEGDAPPQQPPPQQPPPEQPPPDPCANDRTAPTVTIRSLQERTLYRQGQSPSSVRVEASDASGLRSDPSDASRPISTQETGVFTVTATATDNCDNQATVTFRYRVAGDPVIGIAGVRASCVSSNFAATIRVTAGVSIRSLTARLNGRLLGSATKSRLTFRVPAKRLRAGRHTIVISARDRAGNRSTLRATFARCVVVEPSFTG
ncbi:MAG TPA: hypothetical protein VF712_17525 [Thermoleophilaceae bacterium]|jgi:uncharacterized delta-60 repeat protein